jgi:hypothetical protein
MDDVIRDKHQFILNYSSLNMDGLEEALLAIQASLHDPLQKSMTSP